MNVVLYYYLVSRFLLCFLLCCFLNYAEIFFDFVFANVLQGIQAVLIQFLRYGLIVIISVKKKRASIYSMLFLIPQYD